MRSWYAGYVVGLAGSPVTGPVLPDEDGRQYVSGWLAGLTDRVSPVRQPNPFVAAEEWTPPAGLTAGGWFESPYLTYPDWLVVAELDEYGWHGIGAATIHVHNAKTDELTVATVATHNGIPSRPAVGGGTYLFFSEPT